MHHSLLPNSISCVSGVAHRHCCPMDNLKQGHLSITSPPVNCLSCSLGECLSALQRSVSNTFTATDNSRVASRSNMHVFGLREETAAENPCTGQALKETYKIDLGRYRHREPKPQPSCCGNSPGSQYHVIYHWLIFDATTQCPLSGLVCY